MPLEIRHAAEHARRRDARQAAALHAVWQRFLDHGAPVTVAAVGAPREAIEALHALDLVFLDGEVIHTAYPFAAGPNPWAVEVPGGVTRYACCAIDAIGLAPMLGEPVRVTSWCHETGAPIEFDVAPDGPRSLPQTMVWVAPRDACSGPIATGL
jgi:hypothetical protein